MKPPRLPLYAQFLAWLLLNLLLLAGLLVVFAGRDGLGIEMLLTDAARERAQAVGFEVSRQLNATLEEQWPVVLAELGERYGAAFAVEPVEPWRPPGRSRSGFSPGSRMPGDPWRFRSDDGGGLRQPLVGGGTDGGPMGAADGGLSGFGVGFGSGALRGARAPRPPPSGVLVSLTRVDGGYRVHIPLAIDSSPAFPRKELGVTTHGIVPLLNFLGLASWIALLALALLLSALWWWPFFHGITRRIGRLQRVTERIAQGGLTQRAQPGRPDELAQLATSVNRMAEQLHAQVEGQRRFLLDVAHELTSPLARMQVGLAIVQDELPPEDARRLAPVLGDTQQMSELLQDLLQFSRNERVEPAPRLESVDLAALVAEVVRQEDAVAQTMLPDSLVVTADRTLLVRALGNLVRNAVRHGGATQVEIGGRAVGSVAMLTIADRGPGVPQAALAHLGEPFYRPDVARDRNTGGVGLGLAIVRRCIERCGGQLRFANRQGGGFEARLELPLAPAGAAASPAGEPVAGGASPLE